MLAGCRLRFFKGQGQGLPISKAEAANRNTRYKFLCFAVCPPVVLVLGRADVHLAALAREFGFYVLADDVYHLLDWSSAPLRRLLEYDAAYTSGESADSGDSSDPAAAAGGAGAMARLGRTRHAWMGGGNGEGEGEDAGGGGVDGGARLTDAELEARMAGMSALFAQQMASPAYNMLQGPLLQLLLPPTPPPTPNRRRPHRRRSPPLPAPGHRSTPRRASMRRRARAVR